MLYVILMIAFLIPCSQCQQYSKYGPINEKFELIYSTIENITFYYAKNYQFMNIDGIFGLKALKGELSYLLDMQYAKDTPITPEISTRFNHLQTVATNIITDALKSLRENDPSYYKKMGFMLTNPWNPRVFYRNTEKIYAWNNTIRKHSIRITESTSDLCLSELFTTSQESSCSPSQHCIDIMLFSKGTHGYSLTHQIIYTIMLILYRCETAIENKLNGLSVSNLQTIMCTNVLEEIHATLNMFNKSLPSTEQDLYLEQIYVCSSIGFIEFVQENMTSQILSWKHPTLGCFHIPQLPRHRRHLLEEVHLSDGCLAHKTAVALCALTQYLRLYSDINIFTYFPDRRPYGRLIFQEREAYHKRKLPPILNDHVAVDVILPSDPRIIFEPSFIPSSAYRMPLPLDYAEPLVIPEEPVFIMNWGLAAVILVFMYLVYKSRLCHQYPICQSVSVVRDFVRNKS